MNALPRLLKSAASLSLVSLMMSVPSALAAPTVPPAAPAPVAMKFDFGTSAPASGFKNVSEKSAYTKALGYGFADVSALQAVDRGGDAIRGDFITSDKPFYFSVDLPEGNYHVTVLLGDAQGESATTVKSESRRLAVEKVATAQGKFEVRTFTVNIRTIKIAGTALSVGIKDREKNVLHWDDKLTLEFNGARPCVAALEIVPAPEAVTVYLAGDSTVTDQPNEPWSSWGAMFPRFFQRGVAVANHAESGLALSSFRGSRRLDKILSTMKAGDYLFIQFGHNDQKEKGADAGAENGYTASLKAFVAAARAKGGLPVLVTPMERRRFAGGQPQPTLADYAEAVRRVAQELNVPLIDLNAMSLKFYAALGAEKSKQAFVHYAANTFPGQTTALKDDTHFNVYGGYELAKCVVEGIKANVPALAKKLTADVATATFDPSTPDELETFAIPASPAGKVITPDGS